MLLIDFIMKTCLKFFVLCPQGFFLGDQNTFCFLYSLRHLCTKQPFKGVKLMIVVPLPIWDKLHNE